MQNKLVNPSQSFLHPYKKDMDITIVFKGFYRPEMTVIAFKQQIKPYLEFS